MALSNPRIIFGVHSFTAIDRITKLPFGTALVIGSSSFSLSGELVALNAGSNRYPWAVEDGNITAELSLTFKQYETWMMEVFLGKKPTELAPNNLGQISTLTNTYGSTIQDAVTGIASISIAPSQNANLKFGKYVIKAVSATEVDIFAYSNIDFARGTPIDFQNNSLKINATPITITGTNVDVNEIGLRMVVGSGTIAFTIGHTATFEVLPPHRSSIDSVFGATMDVYPEFGALLLGQKRGSGEMLEIEVFRCKAIGLPIGFNEKEFSEAEVTAQAYFDAENGGVFRIRDVVPL